jgi:hypothetical protein
MSESGSPQRSPTDADNHKCGRVEPVCSPLSAPDSAEPVVYSHELTTYPIHEQIPGLITKEQAAAAVSGMGYGNLDGRSFTATLRSVCVDSAPRHSAWVMTKPGISRRLGGPKRPTPTGAGYNRPPIEYLTVIVVNAATGEPELHEQIGDTHRAGTRQ